MAKRIVIVGGGAGGLELAARLAQPGDLQVVLVDRGRLHVWKPLLHEVASGTLVGPGHQIPYLSLAARLGFSFRQGELTKIDRQARSVTLGPVRDRLGVPLTGETTLAYDMLVIAIGGITNDFGITGVRDHAFALDSAEQAEAIHDRVLDAWLAASATTRGEGLTAADRFRVVIVGGGATGVELAAELRATGKMLAAYEPAQAIPARFLDISVLNADARILPQLPEALARSVAGTLHDMEINVRNSAVVGSVSATAVHIRSGEAIPSDLTVWAAGVRGPEVACTLSDLETNRAGQLVVRADLRTTRDERILAIGDCASCPWVGHEGSVPARAQASHQQARHVAQHVRSYLAGRAVPEYRYRDLGSLVSLGGQERAIGTLMGFITGRNYLVGGLLARAFYKWLYKQHRAVLFGWWSVLLESLGAWIGGSTEPRIKLH